MNARVNGSKGFVVGLLTLIALGLLVVIWASPIWWVSLTAPNFPPEAFPDGVRIHFHMNGVFNGCQPVEKAEIREEETLDCVHEMDIINHYVGMYPIAAGGVIERHFAPFLMTMLGVMLVGFAVPKPGLRMIVLAVGFAGLAGWMWLTFYGAEGLRLQNTGYITALSTALDQEAGKEEQKQLTPAQALIAQLKAELEGSKDKDATGPAGRASDKATVLGSLRTSFERDQARRPAAERQDWAGSGAQVLAWHYGKTLGRYFNVPELIHPMVAMMSTAAHVFFWFLIGAMLLMIWGARRNGGIFYWLLVLVPIALPLFFLIDYSAWLWWYGHNLSDMGAFTVKPFMPTVFGDGKVAQFATHSYPHIGFGLMLATSAVLAVAALIRRKQLKNV